MLHMIASYTKPGFLSTQYDRIRTTCGRVLHGVFVRWGGNDYWAKVARDLEVQENRARGERWARDMRMGIRRHTSGHIGW